MIANKPYIKRLKYISKSIAVAVVCLLVSACGQSSSQPQTDIVTPSATESPLSTEDSSLSSIDDAVADPSAPLAETIFLKDYSEVGSGRFARRLRTLDRVQDNYGNYYDNAISGSTSSQWNACDYRVNKQFKYFCGRIVLDNSMRNWSSEKGQEWVSMKVYGDGTFLYESEVLEKGILPQDFNLDIGDVDIVSVEILGKNCLRLVDAIFTNEENPAGWSTMETYADYLQRMDSIPLTDLYYLDTSQDGSAFTIYDSFTDADNNTYSDAIGGNIFQEDNWLLYDLSGQFSTIRGQVVYNPESGTNDSSKTRVLIYGDGNLLYESELVNPGVAAQDFSVDISGIKQMRVCIWGKNHIRIVNCSVEK